MGSLRRVDARQAIQRGVLRAARADARRATWARTFGGLRQATRTGARRVPCGDDRQTPRLNAQRHASHELLVGKSQDLAEQLMDHTQLHFEPRPLFSITFEQLSHSPRT